MRLIKTINLFRLSVKTLLKIYLKFLYPSAVLLLYFKERYNMKNAKLTKKKGLKHIDINNQSGCASYRNNWNIRFACTYTLSKKKNMTAKNRTRSSKQCYDHFLCMTGTLIRSNQQSRQHLFFLLASKMNTLDTSFPCITIYRVLVLLA